MLAPPASTRALAFHRRLPLLRPNHSTLLPHSPGPPLPPRPCPAPPRPCPAPPRALMAFSAETAGEEAEEEALPGPAGAGGGGGEVSSEEWQRWGTSSPLPTVVASVVRQLLEMESVAGEKMRFGGVGSKLKGDFKDVEDRKHRAVYETLADSDQKLQYYSARQIGCRLLGSRGYLCQKCWLPMEDCMCSKLAPCNLWRGIRFWLYMHPKDFLRQNNTGKLLWQVFGIQAASLCLFGIQEHEDIMWDAFQRSGKAKVSFLYPNKSATPKSVNDLKFDDFTMNAGLQEGGVQHEPLNLVLLDGTWSNSAALYRRLKERWAAIWGEEDIPCISLSMLSASVMHKLRPQPAWDRTCTAAAAAGLLSELHMRPELSAFKLEEQAEAVECSLDILLDALTVRRVRLGRSITRKQRHRRDCI
ncbi:hypothetical protein CFC21_103574 [Triticum aestivum]|uniref:tRNA-uridine aminocarboxypropyltransferase n=2 Tax=Triticum aestivum TaxID=4565 RepID=A0A3B6SIT2_WHEAT|nr:uncharacterized protein LOC119340126 [Triticum dicoccoides]XP_044434619.1 uncharacterized protein LOC123160839 [Triticum aestivum]KAF7102436.1 hypothetical protein CFC21_103574 [Triticum aestivum]